jgi:hypothetical protein
VVKERLDWPICVELVNNRWGGKNGIFVSKYISIKKRVLIKNTNLEKTKKKQKNQTHGQGLRKGWREDMGLNFLFLIVFSMFFFCSLANTSRKPKKNKKTKNKQLRPMGKVWGEAWLGTWV